MARAALRPLTAFRPRGAEEPGKPGRPGKRWKPWNKTETPPRTGGNTAKKTAKKTARKTGGKTAPATDAKTGRPLPFPLRLLAMLCAFAFMVAFAVALARVTLEPSPASVALVHSNLRPGDSLRAYLDQPELRDAVKQIGGNLLLGVPFGVLVPVVAPQARGLLRVLLLTAAVMLLVEFAQGALVTGRAFDIDDVILNTSGALIGYLILGRRIGRAVHARKPRG
ncbi:VanZ family protein [Streptomyces sp. SAS_272]|uniref:VanZ family protein n=1 Tax=Streptomyces sp. SAS_272 TaxID=3412747 RepID=UPI00403C31AE